jgi:hypothetical protein
MDAAIDLSSRVDAEAALALAMEAAGPTSARRSCDEGARSLSPPQQRARTFTAAAKPNGWDQMLSTDLEVVNPASARLD